ncbi:MAG TPA: pirin family protein [Burkholderiales bacterium]|nr:pirin family protein [Burkholderiales bacterium]
MSAIAQVVESRKRDLGGFEVRRILPYAGGRMVGPFIFLDHMGPVAFSAGKGIDVRPHPHVCLATVTYLFDGEIEHRDSLGVVQAIKPGDVNWMTAGRGIAHSERTGAALRAKGHCLHGLQSWVALPLADEETEPSFFHHDAADLPARTADGVALRVIAGEAFGMRSPVRVFSTMFYVDAKLDAGTVLAVPDDHAERAAYVVEGGMVIEGREFGEGTLVILRPGEHATLQARTPSRVALLGGDALEGERHIWWNFVASSQERIERAKADWKAGRFAKVPGDDEFIPLPER